MGALDVVSCEIMEALNLFIPRQKGDPTTASSACGTVIEGAVSPLAVMHYGRMRDKAYKLKQGSRGLHINKNHSPCGQKVSGTGHPESLFHLHCGGVSRPKWLHSEQPGLNSPF